MQLSKYKIVEMIDNKFGKVPDLKIADITSSPVWTIMVPKVTYPRLFPLGEHDNLAVLQNCEVSEEKVSIEKIYNGLAAGYSKDANMVFYKRLPR